MDLGKGYLGQALLAFYLFIFLLEIVSILFKKNTNNTLFVILVFDHWTWCWIIDHKFFEPIF
jgi:hypothetical protein